jgi:TonB-linked SusC/RagA family outer membrane protein
MKLTILLLVIGTLHISAATYSQTISISRHNASLKTIFKDIKKQSGYLFFYNGNINITGQKLNVDLKDATIEEALMACLPAELTYIIVDKTIVIRKKLPAGTETPLPASRKTEVTGKVIEADSKKPIPAVNIAIKGKVGGTQTNEAGEFKIEAEPGDVLVFSFIGFKTKEVKVSAGKFISVSMESKVNAINDVVVTGYQTLKKETYTGNVVTIKGEELRKFNSTNVIKGIQSFDPSFRVLDNNIAGSNPNGLPSINVRGATALSSITDDKLNRNNLSSSYNMPTFILDGFEVSVTKVVDLDINRIESITILKDAAATAVYGSRAANGVMVITTKTPQPGKLQLTYNYNLNVSAPDLSDYHLLNAAEKLHFESLSGLYKYNYISGGSQDQLTYAYYDRLKNVVSGVDTYWLSQPLRNSFGQTHSLYAEGGDSTFRYGIDLRYQSRPGVMKGSNRDAYSGGVNFTYNPSKKLIFRNELSVTQVSGNESSYGSFANYAAMNPYYPITDDKGNILQEVARWNVRTQLVKGELYKDKPVFNPLFESTLGNFNKASYLEVIDNFSTDWYMSKSFRLKGLVSLTKFKGTNDKFDSPLNNEFYLGATSDIKDRGRYGYQITDKLAIDGNLRLLYTKEIKDHAILLNAGINARSGRTDFRSFEARGFTNDRFTNIGYARTYALNSSPNGEVSLQRLAGSFFLGNYSYKNKYLLDVTYRLDGSSVFGSQRRFAPFYGGGVGWNIHRELFMANTPVSRLKLTATGGLTGSVSFPPYLSKTTYSYVDSIWYSTGAGALTKGYGNENLQWQKTINFDLGLDIGLFNDRFLINPRYYRRLTKGLLTDIDLAPSTGFTTYKENLGDMLNTGVEVYLTVNAYRNKDWNINIAANMAHNKNQLVKIANALNAYNKSVDDFQQSDKNNVKGTPLLRYKEGQSIYTIYAVKSLGIDPENGHEIYVKRDGSLTYVYDIKDTQPVGETSPIADGSIRTNITYKRFQLGVSLGYRIGGDIYNQTLVDRVENADPRYNVDRRALDQKWTKPGDVTFYKNITDLGITYASSRFVQKYNYLELQSINLSYDFNKDWIRKYGFKSLRPSITANDIFRSSSVEVERGIAYPFARNVTFSLLATF